MSRSFNKILIANRGEIACRIIRTAQSMGYATVAVYSDADRQSQHVAQADMAVYLGGSAAQESYLNSEALLRAAHVSGADAVHPGYGFLSENAAFASACVQAGLVFIGPSAQAIEAMGNKAQAKRRMQLAGVPCAPGYLGDNQDDAHLVSQGKQLGFPLLVKALAGGGGRGMRLVRHADELLPAIAGARRESVSAFGNGDLMLERLIENGRHIEVQVFADSHGNTIHLGERDCTAQRRRQKIMEESPSPVVHPALREAMGRDAIAAAQAVHYCGAGTVEFMVDDQLRHYFLEMNTRLQVEHPVTELVTGLDLVEWQLRVAAGESLPLRQDQIQTQGHAIEVRLYAEDPYSQPVAFAPQTGRVLAWQPQVALHEGVRIDHGLLEGGDITPHYDPMVAKFIAHGADRAQALRRLRAALVRAPLLGLTNNGAFLIDLLDHPAVHAATLHTGTIDAWAEAGEPLMLASAVPDVAWALAALVLVFKPDSHPSGPGWRSESVAEFDMALLCGPHQRDWRVAPQDRGLSLRNHSLGGQIDVKPIRLLHWRQGEVRFEWMGLQQTAVVRWEAGSVHCSVQGRNYVITERNALLQAQAPSDASRVMAPVAGKIVQLKVALGDVVEAGQQLLCIEAMKMEMWQCAQAPGTVVALHANVGEQVELGNLLCELRLQDHPA